MRRFSRLCLAGLALLSAACQPMSVSPRTPTAPPAQASPTTAALPLATASPEAAPNPPSAATPGTDAPVLPFSRLSDSQIMMETLRPETGMVPEAVAGLTRYDMTVELAEDLSEVTGDVTIRYTNREQVSLDMLYLHLFPNLWDGGLEVTDVQVAGSSAPVTYPSDDDVVGISIAKPLAPGESVDVSLRFAVDVPSGDGVGNYGEFAYQDGILALAHFYPTMVTHDTDWRLETPSSQGDVIYHDASLYDVTFIAPASMNVVSTGAVADNRDLPDGRRVWHLVGGPMRDFNIVASEDYLSETRQVGGVEVVSHFLPEDASGGQLALKYAADALRIYQDTFGPYPYRELDVVATGTEAGGIEYPGMIVVARALYDTDDPTGFFQAATAHEVAHQWWYNVIGNDQVNHPWLDEALAQYATQLYYGEVYGPAGASAFQQSLENRWERVDREDKPVGLPVEAYQDREYGAIVYGRGPLFLLALRDQIGADKMEEFLRRYYEEYRWGIATPAGFQALAEEVSGQDLDSLFSEWVYDAATE